MNLKLSIVRCLQLLNIIVSYTSFVTAQKCVESRPKSLPLPTDWSTWNKPLECASDFASKTSAGKPDPKLRTNSIQDFCFLTDMLTSEPSPQGPPLPPRTTLPNYNGFPSPTSCYASPSTPPPLGQNPVHSAGNNPNWAILEHLVRHKAQSFQAYDDLPYVYEYYKPNKWITWPPDKIHTLDKISPPLPKPKAPNPYFVEVTGVSFKGELLHNYLHFRIFANLSVALGKGQVERSETLHPNNASGMEVPNHATGKISALVIMVKDQNGWPIGDFSTSIPCLRTCTKYSHDIYYGDERNAVPCSYTPPHASSHPGMFVFDVDPGRYCTSDLPHIKGGDPATAPTDPDPRLNPQTKRLEGVREVHATWSFGHSTCNFAQRLYIQTLLFEDVETVYPAYLRAETKFPDPKPDGTFDKLEMSDASFLFGWTAQYYILQPTRSSLGAPDYVNLKYLRERDEKSDEIDCHVPLFDAVDPVQSSFRKFAVPSHEAILDPNNVNSADIKVPSRNGYNSALWGIYKQSTANKIGYFGQHRGDLDKCNVNVVGKAWIVDDNEKAVVGEEVPPSATTFFQSKKEKGVRCPCPALASTLPPEKRTADPARVHGRLIHASHMAIAYMLLTPIGCFVARYYKETFVTIFCFQEYWWFMWHVASTIKY